MSEVVIDYVDRFLGKDVEIRNIIVERVIEDRKRLIEKYIDNVRVIRRLGKNESKRELEYELNIQLNLIKMKKIIELIEEIILMR